MKPTLSLLALLLATLSSAHADESSDREKQIEVRRAEYLNWIVEHFGKLEPTMDARDGRLNASPKQTTVPLSSLDVLPPAINNTADESLAETLCALCLSAEP